MAKHRNGAVGDIRLRFRKEQAKFSDLDDMEYAPYAAPTASQAVTFGSKMNEDPLPASANSDFDFLTGPISDDEIPY